MMPSAEVALAWSEDVATLALLQDRELTPALLAEMRLIGFPDNLGMVPLDERQREIFKAMRQAIAALPDAPDTAFMDDLAADFAAIYLTGALDASPFESFWLSDDHLVCQEPMFAMRKLYAEDGLTVPDWRKRPDDHLVFQLQFLARRLERLATKTAADNALDVRDQWRSLAMLLDHHLLRWLPDLTSRVAARCDTEFYAALLLLTDAWCMQLRDLIALNLGEPRPGKEEIEALLQPRNLDAASPEPLHFMPGIGGPSW
jgi:TorA maturation chaperone TorD